MPRVVKVAVIGSGLAGLTAAYLLATSPQRPAKGKGRQTATDTVDDDLVEFQVHLFEKAPSLGMDAASITIPEPLGDDCDRPTQTGSEWRVDVPMRSFQGGYYPQLIELYKHLGVAFHSADFSYSFSTLSPPSKGLTTRMIYNGSSGTGGLSMPASSNEYYKRYHPFTILDRARNLAQFVLHSLELGICFLLMLFYASPIGRTRDNVKLKTQTFGQWSAECAPRNALARWTGVERAWIEYTRDVLVPLFSAVCTAPVEDVWEHPVEEILDYIWQTFGTHHYVVKHGVRDVVKRLSAPLKDVHLGVTITSIACEDLHNPRLSSINCVTSSGVAETHQGFAHIVFATQASQAVPMLEAYLASLPSRTADAAVAVDTSFFDRQRERIDAQIACLSTFLYRSNIVVNHTDSSFLPVHKKDRRDLNLVIAPSPIQGRCISGGKCGEWEHVQRQQRRCDSQLTSITSVSKCACTFSEEEGAVMSLGNKRAQVQELCVSESFTMATQSLRSRKRRKGGKVLIVGDVGYAGGVGWKAGQEVYQTTNPIVPPKEGSVLSVARMQRAVLTVRSKRALEGLYVKTCPDDGRGRLGELQGAGKGVEGTGMWVCGSFAYGGIPLLEGCVGSAKNVVEQGIWVAEGC